MRGLSMSPPRCPCPVFCMYLSVEACLSPSLPFAVFALRLVGCDNVCCSSLVLSITAGSGRFPAVNSQSIYVPFGLVNSKKKSSPLARDNHQGGSGARGTASLPRYAILWLEERYKIGGYGSDTSSGGLLSTRKSSRTRRAPDPERQYGSRETSSPRGAPA